MLYLFLHHIKKLKNIKISHHIAKLKKIKHHLNKLDIRKHLKRKSKISRKSSSSGKRFNVKFTHSGHRNVAMLGMILAFFAILAPLAYTQLPSADAGPKYDIATGLAVSNTMEPGITNALLIIFAIVFLVPVELMIRDYQKNSKNHKTR
ncbi:MAG: hypothetical protein HZB65_04775 [Candidatus Aenigmarchaeota archaeon]|nr:hypothetical protein [Candidatus Aenigmarchaeota archaeon]